MMTSRTLLAALATATVLAGAAPALGHGDSGPGTTMGPGATGQGMTGSSMMAPGMMGSGMMMAPGQAMMPCYAMMPVVMGPTMMSPGMMAPGTMGPGTMGSGMMGSGMMGSGMMQGQGAALGRDLSADDVRKNLDRHLTSLGNHRLQVGPVTETDDDTVAADIVTKDGSLVEKLMIDRHTGMMRRSAE